MTLLSWTVSTPTLPLSVIADDDIIVAAGFADPLVLAGRLIDDNRRVEPVDDLGAISQSVMAYLDGDLDALDGAALDQPGQVFHQQVWEVMRQIPAGQTWTYTELATKAGRPAAVRSAASACARNLIAPFVPCHRVVRSDGTMGGYYYGTDVKRWLLMHESGKDAVADKR